jgi:SAM-dependent methyltransferase
MNRDALDQLVCPLCASEKLDLRSYDPPGAADRVDEGTVTCPECDHWYRIEDGILDFLPPGLSRSQARADFASKHGLALEAPVPLPQEHQKAVQIEHFDEDPAVYEKHVVRSPFYLALDEVTFLDWLERSHATIRGPVLDVGCGTGRQSIPMAQKGLRTLALDTSEEMLRLARGKLRAEGLESLVDLVVCDGENPPVRDGRFGACVFLGLLHHLPDKDRALSNASQKLAPGGLFYCLDPHDSALRFLFDLLMRLWKLYDEEANESLVSRAELRDGLARVGIRSSIRLSTFLPPHLFYFLGPRARVGLLRTTDRLFSAIPGVRNLAGVIIAEGVKA